MATITSRFGINRAVPFLDVELDTDNELFLDSHRIRLENMPSPFAQQSLACVDSLLSTVCHAALGSDPAEKARARKLLDCFSEPKETRLGLARVGFDGHGGSEDVGGRIWETLTTDAEALLRIGVFKHLAELPLVVNGIDRDITSDITTRTIFGPLSDFTAAMIGAFPEFTAKGELTAMVDRQVWDPASRSWAMRSVLLPVVDGAPLLLVPTSWAGKHLLMTSDRFYDKAVLDYAQVEQSFLAGGRVQYPAKKSLRRQPGFRRGRHTNRVVTLRAYEEGSDLFAIFRSFVDERYEKTAA